MKTRSCSFDNNINCVYNKSNNNILKKITNNITCSSEKIIYNKNNDSDIECENKNEKDSLIINKNDTCELFEFEN